MYFTTIDSDNISILESFIQKEHPPNFRYYKTRNIDAIKNHTLTLIGLINNEPIAYGHIDKENDIYWIGICILDKHQGNGYGKNIYKIN